MSRRSTAILLGLITAAGFVLRLLQLDQSLMGDEVSTLWIVSGNSLSESVDLVQSDAEITPPLSFILSWFASHLGSDPNLIKLPALIAGTASIPLVYLLGVRTVGRQAGFVAAVLMALSPFMTYFSGNGRGYSVLVLLLIGSTLSMLLAAEGGRVRWWIAYAVLSCLAMYTHYTALFVLLAQFLWLIWAHPEARKPALLANVAAAVAFLPWLGGLMADLDSPTTPVLEAIQGSGFAAKRYAVEQWAFGHPLIDPSVVPGDAVMILISAGLAAAAVLTALHYWRSAGEPSGIGARLKTVPKGLVLVLLLAVATPAGEFLLSLVGTDLLGARNMTASWFGFALAAGALVTIPGGLAAVVCTVVVLGGYTLASANLLRDEGKVFDTRGPARSIDDQLKPGDVVVDMNAALTSPVPEPPLEAYLDSDPPVYTPELPLGEPPFLPLTPVRPPGEDFADAFAEAEGHRVLLLAPDVVSVEDANENGQKLKEPAFVPDEELLLPEDARIVGRESFPAYYDWTLYTIEVG